MNPEFLDTNIIIRHITQDHPEQSTRASRYLDEIEFGESLARTSEGVLIEAAQVLSSRNLYNLPRNQVREYLSTIVMLPGVVLPGKETYLRALEIWADSSSAIDFVDALNVAHMEAQSITTIVSYDRNFNRFPQIVRREP